MSEHIIINFEKLADGISQLHSLRSGTGMPQYYTSELMNHSRGQMFQSVNELYKQLGEAEEVMLRLVEQTEAALVNAFKSFYAADASLQELIESITPQGGS